VRKKSILVEGRKLNKIAYFVRRKMSKNIGNLHTKFSKKPLKDLSEYGILSTIERTAALEGVFVWKL